MSRSLFALLTFLFVLPVAVGGQSASPASIAKQFAKAEEKRAANEITAEPDNDRALAARAISALKALERNVIVHNSLAEFEENPALARVSFERFCDDLHNVSAEVGLILSRLPQSRLKRELGNALRSYQDGEFWWRQIYKPQVVHVSRLTCQEFTSTPSDTAYLATIPYTIAIHWRQASKYLKRAETDLGDSLRRLRGA